MKKYLFIVFFFGIMSATAQNKYRNEIEAGFSSIQLPANYRSGWFFQQKFNHFLSERIGVGLGFGVGGSASFPQTVPLVLEEVSKMYQLNFGFIDLSFIGIPIFSDRHQLKLWGGFSGIKRNEMRVDSIITNPMFVAPSNKNRLVTFAFDELRQVGIHAGAAYEFSISPRWKTGINAALHSFGKSQFAWNFGLKGIYSLNVSRQALGIPKIEKYKFNYGLKAGGGFGNILEASTKPAFRWSGGLYAETPISKRWLLRGEILYALKGGLLAITQNNVFIRADLQFSYLDFPLIFKYKIIKKLYWQGGMQLGILLNQTVKAGNATIGTVSGVSPVEAGVLTGIAYHLTDRIQTEFRHNQGIMTLATNSGALNRTTQICVSFRLK
jgi:hypothetical protein